MAHFKASQTGTGSPQGADPGGPASKSPAVTDLRMDRDTPDGDRRDGPATPSTVFRANPMAGALAAMVSSEDPTQDPSAQDPEAESSNQAWLRQMASLVEVVERAGRLQHCTYAIGDPPDYRIRRLADTPVVRHDGEDPTQDHPAQDPDAELPNLAWFRRMAQLEDECGGEVGAGLPEWFDEGDPMDPDGTAYVFHHLARTAQKALAMLDALPDPDEDLPGRANGGTDAPMSDGAP